MSRNFADRSRERLLFRKGYPELGYYSESGSTVENEEGSVFDGFKKWWISVLWYVVDAYNMGRRDPRKWKFGVKSGLAFAIVSALTYVTEPVQLISENIIWAILTVILIFEFNVGLNLDLMEFSLSDKLHLERQNHYGQLSSCLKKSHSDIKIYKVRDLHQFVIFLLKPNHAPPLLHFSNHQSLK
ncbi:hypothetical protein QVD17_08142 [Tagetes erecta]|uniref:Uncharacterized protein n=1 Tax=Tagetes erecta TaxID=13708 RepID=A0AAD8KXS2_TARER|nr:hypothetical protein QVD17_08142 [Tagetes erecta]